MTAERQQLEATISGLEAQRQLLGDAIVDAAVTPLRAKLAALTSVPRQTASILPTQRLKQATIVFLDIVGSTPLSLQLDPEEFHGIINGVLVRGTAIVAAHGGKVVSYAGDNLIAVFGGEKACEDAAERAVRCGLELLVLGRTVADEVMLRHGNDGINVRVGIHTGSVLLGGGVQAENTISGLNVNIAARMEQSAPAGGLRISQATYAHVRGVFDVTPQPAIAVKGLDEPMLTYLVERAKPRAFRVATRGIDGVETQMIGRDAEFEQLQHAFTRLFSEHKLAIVTIVADAGLGKSRLLDEFENWADTRAEVFTIFQGRTNPQTHGQPYGLLRDILAWRYQLMDWDTMQGSKDKLEAGLNPLFADEGPEYAQSHAHLIGQLIGLDFQDSRHIRGILHDAKQIRNRAFHSCAQIFRRVVRQTGNPVVLQLDDLHWADDASLDFLNYLAEVNRDVPLLIIGLTRATLFERRTGWSIAEGIEQRIDLLPLDKTGSRQLANELLKKLIEVPAALRELIISGAEGNPFYMEELVKMLIDQGAISTQDQTDADRWTVNSGKLLATQVPSTLTGVLQARIDSLPAAERVALCKASVIGFVFWDQALGALDATAPEALSALAQRELILPRPGAQLDDVREYTFKHQILHKVIYDTVLKRDRRELHARTARWLGNLTSVRAKDYLGATAGHYELAGDMDNAIEFFTRAAEHAQTGFAHDATLDYVARGIALLDADPDNTTGAAQSMLRWRLLNVRERTLALQGLREAQRADLDALESLAEANNNNLDRAELAFRRCHLAMRMGDYPAQEAAALQTMTLASRADNEELRLNGQRLLADALAKLGHCDTAKTLAFDGLLGARKYKFRRAESLFLNVLGMIACNIESDNVVGQDMFQQCLVINRELGDRVHEATNLGNLGYCWMMLGELETAKRDLLAALQLGRSIGDRAMEGGTLINLSAVALIQGDEVQASQMAGAALDIVVAIQAADLEVLACITYGKAKLALGLYGDAAAAFDRADARAKEIDIPYQLDAAAGRARVALAEDNKPGALACLENILKHLDNGGTLDGTADPRLIELTCHQVLAAICDPRATDFLVRAHNALQAKVDSITDPALRESFLTNIPEHREIVAAWSRRAEVVLVDREE